MLFKSMFINLLLSFFNVMAWLVVASYTLMNGPTPLATLSTISCVLATLRWWKFIEQSDAIEGKI